jgi:Integrase core domain/Chromo (CHRromatin Organisation MOdifier) domain
MNESYYDVNNTASFGGVRPLAREFNTTSASNWLKSQDAYTLHKPLRKRFPRRKTFAKGINDLFQADLADIQNLSRSNDGHRYILTCIDVFSKRAFALAIKDKQGSTLAAAFEIIFSDIVPNMIQTDRGTEFLNSLVQAVFKKYNIHHYWSLNDDIKAACVERFNRTLKTRLYRYFTAKHTNRWIDVLQSLINTYNKSFHRTIGMAPNDVTSDNAQQVAERMYPLKVVPKFKFQLGDTVRITIYKHVFVKGYIQNWTNEVYTISERHESNPPTYTITDLVGEEIKGRFYEQELQMVVKTEEDEYIVEKVLKTRKRNGRLEHYVKWYGYDDKFNSWTTSLRKL